MAFMQTSKWNLPGWRIEQKYSSKVLVGNWIEDRKKFQRGHEKSGSTYLIDFRPYNNFSPDNITRRTALLKNEGLDKKLIFANRGQEYSNYSNNLITWYDQQYNGREHTESCFPPTRSWDRNTLTWMPERSDHPLTGGATNFGLLEKKKQKWKREQELESIGTYVSIYSSSYLQHSPETLVVRHFATPKPLSSHFQPNNINKDLPFRENRLDTAAEHEPSKIPSVV